MEALFYGFNLDGRFEVGRVVAVVVPLPIRILIGRIDRSVDQRPSVGRAFASGKYGTEISTTPRLRSG